MATRTRLHFHSPLLYFTCYVANKLINSGQTFIKYVKVISVKNLIMLQYHCLLLFQLYFQIVTTIILC